MGSHLAILRKLIALGKDLPEVFEIIQRISPDIARLIEISKGVLAQPMGTSIEELAEIESAENELATMLAPDGTYAAGGERIKNLLEWIAAHPQIIAVILSLL